MNEKFKKYLPLGSVVIMKEATKRVMITGYAAKSPASGERVWDYIGCLWPEGMIRADKNLLFDHKDIHQIFAIGYSDEEQKKFMTLLDEATKMYENNTNQEVTNPAVETPNPVNPNIEKTPINNNDNNETL